MSQKNILIADDNEHIRDAVACLLEDEGFGLLLARNGREALDVIHERRPELVILDVMMPELNGYEVCRIIKNDPILKSICVVMLSAKGQASEQDLGKEAGADHYIIKPFSALELIGTIKRILNT
jgi:DNA-binding response OmpR family regulator